MFLWKPEKVKIITNSVFVSHNFLRGESTTGKIYHSHKKWKDSLEGGAIFS